MSVCPTTISSTCFLSIIILIVIRWVEGRTTSWRESSSSSSNSRCHFGCHQFYLSVCLSVSLSASSSSSSSSSSSMPPVFCSFDRFCFRSVWLKANFIRPIKKTKVDEKKRTTISNAHSTELLDHHTLVRHKVFTLPTSSSGHSRHKLKVNRGER